MYRQGATRGPTLDPFSRKDFGTIDETNEVSGKRVYGSSLEFFMLLLCRFGIIQKCEVFFQGTRVIKEVHRRNCLVLISIQVLFS